MEFPAKRPLLPYIIIDQNVLRDRKIISHTLYRCKKDGLSILFTDAAILEMLKGDKWVDTTRRSLVGLQTFLDTWG